MHRKIIPYRPILTQYARNLRNHSTRSEIYLWKHLKGKQRLGYDFHRQKPIERFIADFYCCDLMLAIELDGITHTYPEVIEKDRIKTRRFQELGITLLRFEDKLVFYHINWVLEEIDATIVRLRASLPTP